MMKHNFFYQRMRNETVYALDLLKYHLYPWYANLKTGNQIRLREDMRALENLFYEVEAEYYEKEEQND